ncbi:hypothetical protein BU23DRAFT_650854 [Bimuria novae-zelandiae CBS 107.79]|uniref:non-specific serine/threonine protein kinase n=1 Tax=Bimuria novae-zelandiae CBS 107.79 TaxID=1447943 RepID=A0A6A5V043_9PLEO|nr:hypothetical protein BU23DRAFT_650854 [Bimuria novae-zelandiae CBS 107.79]
MCCARVRGKFSFEFCPFTRLSSSTSGTTFISQRAHIAGDTRIHLWTGDGNYNQANSALALDAGQRAQRIQTARVGCGNVAVDVDVIDDAVDESPSLSPTIPVEADPTLGTAGALNWRYAWTIYERGVSVQERTMFTSVVLYVGEDGEGRLRDRYQYLNQTKSPNILRNRHSEPFTWPCSHEDEDCNPVADDDGAEMRLWFYGVKSYTDFCDGGDLRKLFNQYASATPTEQVPVPPYEQFSKVPELFLAKALVEMAEALYELQTGTIFVPYPTGVEDPRRQSDYDQQNFDFDPIWEAALLHCDIKPHNIFPRSQDGEYPQAVLADFDLATRLTDETAVNFRARGTEGYMSPVRDQTLLNRFMPA